MQIVSEPKELQRLSLEARCAGQITALVPTMGYYHAGHLSLMQWARANSDLVLVSLFVNPAQFGPGEDLESYPRDFERDSELARQEGVDVLFAPQAKRIYPQGFDTWVDVQELSRHLCGKSRPGHFQGVCTVVCKLLNLALPSLAVFGQKDWQQLAIIQRMAEDLNLPVQIMGRPILRESDGLAMSSRNSYLEPEQRRQAAAIYAGLQRARDWVAKGCRNSRELLARLQEFYQEQIPSGQIDYLELVDPQSLTPLQEVDGEALLAVAIHLGRARLIDNILLEG
ncbi:MAG: pantoate--beta-alanine ligase [Thermodesulfobacteriota bacterium]